MVARYGDKIKIMKSSLQEKRKTSRKSNKDNKFSLLKYSS